MATGLSITQKILKTHFVNGQLSNQTALSIKIDQTLTQDATGTLCYLQFETLGISKPKTELSVSYIDHNTLQNSYENADDHAFLKSIAEKYGIIFSPAGNGVCHQLHIENFARPGATLIGSDSHTPTAGGLAMLSFGAGGLDVACAMAGLPLNIKPPEIINVNLTGKLKPYSSAKDVILELLRRLGVKGGVGKIFEYSGAGVKTLSVPERATIANMGAELGATTSIFPADEISKKFMAEIGRAKQFRKLEADKNARYDGMIEVDLAQIEPLIALPHTPDNVKLVSEVAGLKVDQVCIGSCTNSSLSDMVLVSEMLKNRKIHPDISLVISPGSRSVLLSLEKHGYLANIIESGARLIECACGPCIGLGQAPKTGAVSVRTFNRNFEGRSGTKDAGVYLASPLTAVLAALHGELVDPKTSNLARSAKAKFSKLENNKKMFISPARPRPKTKIIRGPNIKALPIFGAYPESISVKVLIKLPDNISTDHILPAGSKILPLRSNIPAISEFAFSAIDSGFVKRAKENKGGMIIAGENYGQGSSREHAALALKYLSVEVVIAKSFARIHLANLINFGVLPAVFVDRLDYDKIRQGDTLEITKIDFNDFNSEFMTIKNISRAEEYSIKTQLNDREKEIIKAGGLLNFVRQELKQRTEMKKTEVRASEQQSSRAAEQQ